LLFLADIKEIDYLIQHDTSIIPIEVKSGAAGYLRKQH